MWAAIAAIAALVGAAIAGYSSYTQAQAQERAADYNALVAQNQADWAAYNAKVEAGELRRQAEIYELNAVLAEESAGREAKDEEDRKQKLLATQAARYGKAGLLLEGTPLEVMAITSLEADKDIESILYEGALEAWNWRTKGSASLRSASNAEITGASLASTYRSEAALNVMKGETAESTGLFSAGSTIATGAANAASIYAKNSRAVPTWEESLLTSGGSRTVW